MARIREKTLKFPGLNNTYTFADEADLFDANVDCAVGEYRIYNGDLYCCTTAHTGAWDASHFKAVKMGNEVFDLKTRVVKNTVNVSDTNFAEYTGTNKVDTAFTDIDRGAVKYEGYSTVAGTYRFVTSNAFHTYVFRCPQDNFAISTNIAAMYIVGKYPNPSAEAEVIDVLSVLFESNDTDFKNVTIPKKGDLVLCTIKNIRTNYMLTNINAQYKSEGLTLDNVQNVLMRYADFSNTLSSNGNDKLNITKVSGKMINGTYGSLSDNAYYDTYYFRVPIPEMTIKCTNGFRACIDRVAPANDGTGAFTENFSIKQLLYSNATSRVETFTAVYGDYVVISVPVAESGLALYTNFAPSFTLNGLQVEGAEPQQFYKYSSDGSGKYLGIYFKSGEYVVCFELHNVPAASINSNTWQLGATIAYAFDGSVLSSPVTLIDGGEYEIAFKETGAADYCGGNNHGDENTDSFVLHIDGKIISDLTSLDNNFHRFERIDAFEVATINRCDTPAEDIAEHKKVWIFEDGKVKIKQTLKFIDDLSIDGWLCCMCKAQRSQFPYGIRQGTTDIEDMSDSGFTEVDTTGNEMWYMFYGDNATIKISARTEDHTPKAKLWIDDQTGANKLYYAFFGTKPDDVSNGDSYYWESEYDVAFTSAT